MLGPLLFVIYFRDLPESAKGSCNLYADDTMLYDVHHRNSLDPSVCCHLPADLDNAVSWVSRWNTTFNVQKSAELVISQRHQRGHTEAHPLHVSSAVVPRATKVKHLGIMLSSTLSWSEHIQELHRKVGYKIYL